LSVSILGTSLRSYKAAVHELGCDDPQICGRWLNNRVENSRLPFQQRERAMQRLRRMRRLQKFAAVRPSAFNHFYQDRSLSKRVVFQQNPTAALNEWRNLCAA